MISKGAGYCADEIKGRTENVRICKDVKKKHCGEKKNPSEYLPYKSFNQSSSSASCKASVIHVPGDVKMTLKYNAEKDEAEFALTFTLFYCPVYGRWLLSSLTSI